MALTDADLEGFTLVSERRPEKAGGVTVSQIPATLVKLLESEAPKALADKDHELILRLPVRPDYSEVPEVNDKSTEAEKAANAKAKAEADSKALALAMGNVKQLALYATAWGKGQDPKLYITRQPPRKDEKDVPIARLKVRKDEDVPAANRAGRR